MRANPLVCLEADEVSSPQDWATVVIFGKYEKLPDTPRYGVYRKHAYDLLQRGLEWWEPGFVKTVLGRKTRPMNPVYFRIHIDQISGHRVIPDIASNRKLSATHERTVG